MEEETEMDAPKVFLSRDGAKSSNRESLSRWVVRTMMTCKKEQKKILTSDWEIKLIFG